MSENLKRLHQEGKFQEAFKLLVKENQEALYWHARRMVLFHEDADDVLQNALVKAWKAFPKFRFESSIYTWLYRITTNESLTFLKKKKQTVSYAYYLETLDSSLQEDDLFDGDEIQRKLQLAIATLPEKQSAVFNLRYFQEMPYAEMSKIMETSEGALKASYHHAVKKIEDFLKSH